MNHEIVADHDHEVIVTKVWGELTAETVTDLTKDVGRTAAQHGYDRLLFDMRETTESATTMDAFSLAANPEQRGLARGQKRAIVHNSDNALYDFFETVSTNRATP